MAAYPLWGFEDSTKIIFTRGQTEEQAYQWAEKSWKRGQTISMMVSLPITAYELYSLNHDPDWENRKPDWITVND